MKLLNVGLARSIWFFQTEDMNPRGLDLFPVVAAIQSRYRFQKYPTKADDIYAPPNGIRFETGAFRLEEGRQIEVLSLVVYNDGLVADTRHSSAATDSFLGDVLSFLSQNHRLTFDQSMIRAKDYLSEVIVTTEMNLDRLSEKMSRFAAILSAAGAGDNAFQATAIRFGTDPGIQRIPVSFSFERRSGVPFDRKRYFSTAPFQMETHLQLLEEYEKIMV